MTAPDRRTLLQAALAAPWVHGLADLLQDKPTSRPSTRPDPFAEALAAAKAKNAPCLAIAIPAQAEERARLADVLNVWFDEFRGSEVHALFLRAVWLCAPRERLPVRGDETVVLLDPVGARVEGAAIAFEEQGPCCGALHALLDRYETARRAQLQKVHPKSTEPEAGARELALLAAHAGGMNEEFTKLVNRLVELCTPGSYVLWMWRTTSDANLEIAAEMVIASTWSRGPARDHLPFGVVESPLRAKEPVGDPCPACGMAIRSRRASVALRFL